VDKAVVTILLMVAGVICSLVVFNTAYPAINRGASAISSISTKVDDRVKSQVEIIETASQSNEIYIWVKNTGAAEIAAIEQCDVFLGQSGATERIPYNSGIPRWEYTIENNTEWVPTATVKITITLSSDPSGNYYIKVVIPNGISDVHQFSI
jgi:flagellar protein FlaG